MPVMDIQQAVSRRNAMVAFVKQIMVPDIDYGKVPGTTKDTLFKPGAEKLSTFFGLSPRFVVVKAQEEWGDNGTPPFFYYWYKCELYRGDQLVGEGDGSCNSHESKYRYRHQKQTCPQCGAEAISRSKFPPRDNPQGEKGWWCRECHTDYAFDDPAITNQELGRILNPDVADQANTILKMAQKRALIAAVLVTVNASEYFTQDLEDFEQNIIAGTVIEQTTQAPAPKPTQKNGGNGHDQVAPVDPAQWDDLPVPANFTELYARVEQLHITGKSPEARRKHTAAIITNAHGETKATPASAWQALIDHQRSKEADAEGTEDDDIAELWPAELEPVEA